jgi:hypothetical protein
MIITIITIIIIIIRGGKGIERWKERRTTKRDI